MPSVSAISEAQPQPLVPEAYHKEVKSIEQYLCPFCLQTDALYKVYEEGGLIDGWGCQCNATDDPRF